MGRLLRAALVRRGFVVWRRVVLTWLHVSDFHIQLGDPYDRDVVLGSLVASVRRFRADGRRPDVVFATGDIAHSGKPGEYEIATVFFDALLYAAGLSRRDLFVIAGNHDVDRKLGVALARSLASREEADSYFAPGFPRPHLTQKQAAFSEWYRGYFEGIRECSDSSCGPVESFEAGGVRVGVLPINSALFCQGDDDHAKLCVGRRALASALADLSSCDVDLRVALIHHPLEWLADIERSNVRARLAGGVDVVLRGHLHEADVEQVVSPHGGLVHLAAGAAYQTGPWPKRALFVTVEDSGLRVFPIRYEDSPTEVWTVDPSVFPNEEDHTGLVQLAGATPTGVRSPGSSRGVTVIGQEPASSEPVDEGVALERDHEDLLLALYKYDGKCTIAAPVGEYKCLWVPSFLVPMQWGWERTPAEAEISGKPRGDRTKRMHWLFVVEDLVERGFLKETSAPQVEETSAPQVFELTKVGQRFAYTLDRARHQ